MGRVSKRCPYNEPDCFNCTFPDCQATLDDINRQQALKARKQERAEIIERNKQILEMYNNGVRPKDIQLKLGVTHNVVINTICRHKKSLHS